MLKVMRESADAPLLKGIFTHTQQGFNVWKILDGDMTIGHPQLSKDAVVISAITMAMGM
jgi:hypothetical protein